MGKKIGKSSQSKAINLSVIILQGGSYDKDLYKECLDSLYWADEIIKIDSDKYNAGFADLRNIGAKEAKGKWLLYVDTDEIVTPKLKDIIINSISKDSFAGYAIPRRNIVLGKEMTHCGLWPDYVLRLIKKDKLIGWYGDLHEQPKIDGKIFHLSEPLIHRKHDNLSEMVEKTNKWSEIEARLMFDAHHPKMNLLRFASAGIREFWLRMITQSAFMDGTRGIIYGLYQVFSKLISYSKLWELQLKHASSNL